jgi:hypothetical protein
MRLPGVVPDVAEHGCHTNGSWWGYTNGLASSGFGSVTGASYTSPFPSDVSFLSPWLK